MCRVGIVGAAGCSGSELPGGGCQRPRLHASDPGRSGPVPAGAQPAEARVSAAGLLDKSRSGDAAVCALPSQLQDGAGVKQESPAVPGGAAALTAAPGSSHHSACGSEDQSGLVEGSTPHPGPEDALLLVGGPEGASSDPPPPGPLSDTALHPASQAHKPRAWCESPDAIQKPAPTQSALKASGMFLSAHFT